MRGTGVSSGIVVGKAFVVRKDEPILEGYQGENEDFIRMEIRKYDHAVRAAIEEVGIILSSVELKLSNTEKETLEIQLMYLDDPRLREDVVKLIHDQNKSAMDALIIVGRNLVRVYEAIDEDFKSVSAAHVQDINNRILKHLNSAPQLEMSEISDRTILIADDISVKDLETINMCRVVGIAIGAGNANSPLADFVRLMKIPAVVGCGAAVELVRNNDMVIIDGSSGLMLINPDAGNLKEFQRLRDDNERMSDALEMLFESGES